MARLPSWDASGSPSHHVLSRNSQWPGQLPGARGVARGLADRGPGWLGAAASDEQISEVIQQLLCRYRRALGSNAQVFAANPCACFASRMFAEVELTIEDLRSQMSAKEVERFGRMHEVTNDAENDRIIRVISRQMQCIENELTSGEINAVEALCVMAYVTGMVIALQDQGSVSPEQAMDLVARYLADGNAYAVGRMSENPVGTG